MPITTVFRFKNHALMMALAANTRPSRMAPELRDWTSHPATSRQ